MRALIAEDDPISRRMLELFLVKWGYEVVVAREGEEAWRLLEAENAPRLAVLDWMMPGKAGIEICRDIRQRHVDSYTYVILLTARGHKQDLVEGLDAGADDYVTKPFDPVELQARLRAGQRIVDLHQQLLQAQEALRNQASRDPLTGLYNHGAILTILRKEVARASRSHGPFALAMADVDKFKTINDTYGHLVGDAILREASSRLLGAMRDYDSLGRYGGDEFLAIIPGCDPAGIASFAEGFRSRIGSEAVETSEGPVLISMSLGVAALENLPEVRAETLVKIADATLYRAKLAGRNCVALATEDEIEREIARSVEAPANATHARLISDFPVSSPPI